MFTGFQIELPTYEVITPQTRRSLLVSSLTVAGEEKLKSSLVSESKILDHLNRCIFNSIQNKPEDLKTYNDFLNKITIRDRDALLYGLYHITYEDIRNYRVTCNKCDNAYDVTVKASDTFSMNPYPENKNILDERVKEPLKITKPVTAVIKQPTLADENEALRTLGARPWSKEMILESLIIDNFEYLPQEATEPQIIDDPIDKIHAYLSLPSRDKKQINKAYMDAFGNYRINLKMSAQCTSCGNIQEVDIDLVENFFRSLYE